MGFYQEQILPRFQDKVMGRAPNRAVRTRVCEGLQGSVVEVGFGTALNARYYPAEVTKVVAIEPSQVCMRIAEPRIAKSSVPVEYGGLTGERLDLPSGEFDAVLSTWTLCTIPNLRAALDEMRRVLKPGGSFHFVEHGHAPDEKIARWQQRLETAEQTTRGWLPSHATHLQGNRAGRFRHREDRDLLLRGRAEADGLHLRRPSSQINLTGDHRETLR